MGTYLDERYPVIELAGDGGERDVDGTRSGQQSTTADVLSDLYAMRDVTGMDVSSDLKLACLMELVGNAIERYQSQ